FADIFCDAVASRSTTSQPFTNRKAFQILLAKFLPCSQYETSNIRSFPAGEDRSIPTRTPSVPYCSINSIGSGEFPNDFDILRPNLSLTIPVRYTLRNGGFCV